MKQGETEVKKTARWLSLLTAEFILVFILLLLSIIGFAFALNIVFVRPTTYFDDAAFRLVSKYVSTGRTSFMLFITSLGNHRFLIPANLILLFFYLFVRKNRKLTIRVTAIALSSLTLKLILKNSFQRLRPDIPLLEKVRGFSFPSGHALMSVTFYGLLIYIVSREIKHPVWRTLAVMLLTILILLISFSRIYLRVHYASDVIAGLAIGLIWLVLSLWIIARIEKKRFARKAIAGQP